MADLGCPDFVGVFSNYLWLLLLGAWGIWFPARYNLLLE